MPPQQADKRRVINPAIALPATWGREQTRSSKGPNLLAAGLVNQKD
jgi:hypothetical protein